MDGVVTVMKAGGQYQVVIGNHVTQVFDELNQVLEKLLYLQQSQVY